MRTTSSQQPTHSRARAARFAALALSISGALMVTAAFASPVSGRDLTVDTTYVWADPGTHVELGRAPVSGVPASGDAVCTWTATATSSNQHSVHPGNDIVVSSGATSIVLSGVEDVAGGAVTGSATGVLGDELVATLVVGPDGVFSGGVTVTAAVVSCTSPTTEPAVTEPPTTEPVTTEPVTTEPPATVAPSGPTTAPTTAVPTTAVPTTAVPTTAVVVAPTTPALTELPVTGPGATAALAAVGVSLLAAGFALTRYATTIDSAN